MQTEIVIDTNTSFFKFTDSEGETYFVEIDDNAILEMAEEKLIALLQDKRIFEQYILRIHFSEGKYIVVFEKGENG